MFIITKCPPFSKPFLDETCHFPYHKVTVYRFPANSIFSQGGCSYEKGKQILAIIGIILLVVLYLSTLVCAITDNTGTMKMFKASIFATFVIPVLIWAYTFLYKLTHKK